jgi:hypothetical protein
MELTEQMIDAPRGFLLGLEIGCSTLKSMRSHLDRLGDDYECWPEWAKTEDGHISKAAKAILINAMMQAASPKGWQLVPIEPTLSMIGAGGIARSENWKNGEGAIVRPIWDAMLAEAAYTTQEEMETPHV